MKKTLISLALLATSGSVLATELYNGRLSGMAGAGYVTGGYSDGVLLNPSLVASHGAKDDFALVINAGALGSDKDDLIDGLDDLVDFTDYLQSATNLTEADADELKRLMANVDDKTLGATFGASTVLAIPNSIISAALILKATGTVGLLANIDDSDYELIDDRTNTNFDPEDLQSSVIGRGVVVKELGVALAKNVSPSDDYQLLVGITPKRIEVDTIVYEATVADYDEDDLDADDYTITGKTSGLDAGITYIKGNLRYGLTISNLSSKKFKSIAEGETFELATRTTAAIGYTGDWYKAEASVDLDAVPTFGLGGDTQIFRAGVEVSPLSWLQLRAGIQRDLEDTLPDAYSVGIGFSPFNVINIDLAGYSGSDETVGGAVQLGLRF
ncbi:conjugal transfer protein TraF [Cellvibrio japonicus]|uniref:Putative traF n=1 Tax=Cellvibrio japonicus (strain Ueda107) TaxID=498211 RepID=B3PHJ2_CELJU|nr:conjugal transfer protein TraF [Cellvibrio japonicus]ACE85486.1 putative traF [Cellvibrio japonicus Ueda107]QEI12469.1 conjugal transfer protein TraF [Cellvibrio japonicus]QEI16043.1 conjugal transfer protein TraF [Cellvibrio japonicus]QEI19621.1 conjugal transfer protein TraF [Cellvibrio japonicus]